MATAQDDDVVVASGAHCVIVCGRRTNGSMPAKEWLDSQSETLQAAFGQYFKQLAEKGSRFPNPEQFKKLKGVPGDVWEFRKAEHRLFCVEPVAGDTRWFLTNYFRKGGSKNDQTRAAKLALKIAAEHLEREAEKTADSGENSTNDT